MGDGGSSWLGGIGAGSLVSGLDLDDDEDDDEYEEEEDDEDDDDNEDDDDDDEDDNKDDEDDDVAVAVANLVAAGGLGAYPATKESRSKSAQASRSSEVR
jgi:hypothetical protein